MSTDIHRKAGLVSDGCFCKDPLLSCVVIADREEPIAFPHPIPLCPMTSSCAIALGSNLGDSRTILKSALHRLEQISGIQLIAHSRIYETRAVGPPQPDYLNSCATLRVDLPPQTLLQTLLAIEAALGRVRREPWGPRTLDLDLLLFDDLILQTPTLHIPHPRMTERAFVLVPLAEIAPHWIEPISGRAIVDLVKAVDSSGVRLAPIQPIALS